jgi:hypothetical protein
MQDRPWRESPGSQRWMSAQATDHSLNSGLGDAGCFGYLGHRVIGRTPHISDGFVSALAQVVKSLAGVADLLRQLAEALHGRHTHESIGLPDTQMSDRRLAASRLDSRPEGRAPQVVMHLQGPR